MQPVPQARAHNTTSGAWRGLHRGERHRDELSRAQSKRVQYATKSSVNPCIVLLAPPQPGR